jgi:hypothetical protein
MTAVLDRPYTLPEEVIPGVSWPAHFREEFNSWAASFFGLQPPPPAPSPIVEEPRAAALVAVAATAKRARSHAKTATQKPKDTKTFSELLENLEDSFTSIAIPPFKGNWLSRRDISALHKLGIYVPHPWLFDRDGRKVSGKVYPTMASVHMIPSRFDTKEKAHARFAFAIKETRLPINVEQIKGVAYYRFGICVNLTEKERDDASPMRSFWCWCWISVLGDGTVACPKELRQQSNLAYSRRVSPGDNRISGARRVSWVSREWRRPTLMTADQETHDGGGGWEQHMIATFCQLINWWTSRADRWSVAVKKDSKRITFSVGQDQTAAYFADRDKTIKAADGTAKKIIHYVRPHTRENGANVREHVRGLREFDWLGYHCLVTAPGFTGRVLTASFDLLGTKTKPPNAPDMLDAVQVASLLSSEEDRDTRKRNVTIDRNEP